MLIAHHPPNVQYSSGNDWCAMYESTYHLSACEDQNPRIDINGNLGHPALWYVLAAWDETKEWCGAELGLSNFDPSIFHFIDWGPCPATCLDLPTSGWTYSGTINNKRSDTWPLKPIHALPADGFTSTWDKSADGSL